MVFHRLGGVRTWELPLHSLPGRSPPGRARWLHAGSHAGNHRPGTGASPRGPACAPARDAASVRSGLSMVFWNSSLPAPVPGFTLTENPEDWRRSHKTILLLFVIGG